MLILGVLYRICVYSTIDDRGENHTGQQIYDDMKELAEHQADKDREERLEKQVDQWLGRDQ